MPVIFCSSSTIARASALKPDAEEAIPLLCGNVFSVSISNLYEKIYGHHSLILSKKDSILGTKEGFSVPFTVKLKEKSLDFLKLIVVLVKQLDKVKLIEGLVGI
jgi:hypothetical protein